jgi:hypothetical protein
MQPVKGQYYETGEDPASVKWLQIKTERFNIIYPEKYGKSGIDFARALDSAHSRLINLFPAKKFKIPVIIHSFTTTSNGYVAWAPKRIELYPTPEQNTIPGNPGYLLVLHELTHAFEMEALNSGFSGAMTYLFGEQFTGIVSSLLPLWYLEGDAVFAETMFSNYGRGRSPSFQKELKALTTEGKLYKYDKILNGSFRNYIPDHYQYGYQMVTWARTNYGMDIWNKTLRFTAQEPFSIIPVNISLRKNAGLTKKKLYYATFDSLKTIWSRENTGNTAKYEILNPDKKREYINYYSPVFASKDSIIAIKTSLSQSPAFVIIDPFKKTEKVLCRPGYIYPYLISYAAGKILWVENKQDERWENRDFSVIRTFDLKTGKAKTVSHRTRYLSASISPSGKEIAAVENTVDNKNNLVILDAATGKPVKTIPSPDNMYLQRPQWSNDGRKITVINLTDEGEGITSWSSSENRWENLLSGKNDLQSSFLRNDTLFFVSSVNGTENIFMSLPGRKTGQLTRSEFGAIDLNISENRILFSDYNSQGNSIALADIGKAFEMMHDKTSSQFLIYRAGKIKEKPDSNSKEYTPVPYRKWQHLFRFHSWMPFYADLDKIQSDPLSVRPGVTLMSQNTLSTIISSVGYEYSTNREHLFHSKVTWKGWYPVIESGFDYGYTPHVYGEPPVLMVGTSFKNTISLPLNFSSGRFYHFLRPSLSADYSNNVYSRADGSYDYGQTIFTGRLFFSNFSRTAVRDIYPEWGQVIDLNYVSAPFDKKVLGSDLFIRTAFYFPGFLRDNSIKIRYEKERQFQSRFIFGNRISFPRGYGLILADKLEFISADYMLPLVYPDLNISSLIYLKRIRSGFFYDHATGRGNRHFTVVNGKPSMTYNAGPETFRSFGLDLLSDFHLFRVPFMISGGAQAAWKDWNTRPFVSMLLNINLYGMTLGRRQL